MRGDVRLATLSPIRTRIPHREDVGASFLVAGPHWQQVADLIRDAEPELVAEWGRDQDAKAASAAAKAERRRAARRWRIDRLGSTSARNSSAPALTRVDGSGLSGKSPTNVPWCWSVPSAS